jgi:hypothetical protein
MKMLFSSSDITEIGRVGREFAEAGILCGVRYDPPREGASPAPAHAELWVQNQNDFYRAVVLYLRVAGELEARTPGAATRALAGTAIHPAPVEGTLTQPGQPIGSA